MRESWTLTALRSSCFALLLLAFPEGVKAFDLVRVADLTTSIPDGSGTFTSFIEPVLSGRNVAFRGFGAFSQQGIYLFNGTGLARVADKTTPIPGGSGTFTSFSQPKLSGDNIAFQGIGAFFQSGIYLFNDTGLMRVADNTTPIPDGSGTFQGFGVLDVSGDNVAFRASRAFNEPGIYVFNGTSLARVADWTTPIPDGNGTFTSFLDVVLSGDNVAFRGSRGFDQPGIYLFNGTDLVRVADKTTPIQGGSGTFTSLAAPVLSGGNVAFQGFGGFFERAGLYLFNGAGLARVADQTTRIPGGSGTFDGFEGSPVLSGGNVAFVGGEAFGQRGIFLSDGTRLTRVTLISPQVPIRLSGGNMAFLAYDEFGQRVIYFFNGRNLVRVADETTPIPGGSGTFTGFGVLMLSGDTVAFQGFGESGQHGIYLATPSGEPPELVALTALSPARLWVGLRNSDDIGTAFDLRVELYLNANLVTAGLTRCIRNLTRAPSRAMEVEVMFNPFEFVPVSLAEGDVLSLRVLTRVGTNTDDTRCTGPGASHSSATGLRLYYDAAAHPSHFDVTIGDETADVFLHSDGGACTTGPSAGVTTRGLDDMVPVSASARCVDSAAVKFVGGNAWSEIATWSMAPMP